MAKKKEKIKKLSEQPNVAEIEDKVNEIINYINENG